MAAESVKTDRVTPLYKTASKKSTIQLYVQSGVTLHVSETKTDGDCKFGKTPGGWALLEGKVDAPNFSSKKQKMTNKKMVQGTWVFGPYAEATAEEQEVTRTFKFAEGIPERAWSALCVKVTHDVNSVYSGGFNRKDREHVYVLVPRVIDAYTCELKANKRLYPHEVPKEKEGYAWSSDLTIAYTIRVPKEEVESEDESDDDGGNALLGGDSSDDDSSS